MRRNTRNTGSVRLLVVDDHTVFREVISTALAREGFAIVGESGTGEEAVRLARDLHPDIVLMDVRMPGMGGVRATAALLKVSPESRVVGLSMSGDRDTILQMMQAGACAFVEKRELDDLLAVLHRLTKECRCRPIGEVDKGALPPHAPAARRGGNASNRDGALPR